MYVYTKCIVRNVFISIFFLGTAPLDGVGIPVLPYTGRQDNITSILLGLSQGEGNANAI